MRRLLMLICLASLSLFALPALADDPPLDLTMTIDLYCGDPAVSGMLGTGWNVATVGNLCGGMVNTGGTANAYGVNLLTPTQLVINTVSPALQVTVLSGPPYLANNCVAYTSITVDPTLNLCLPAGYYSILLSSPLNIITPYEISLGCAPCEPVSSEARSWGAIKGAYR
jgi:hypothetical protein